MDEDTALMMRALVDDIVDGILHRSHFEQFPLATDISTILSESPEAEIISRLEPSKETLVLQPRCVDQNRGGYCHHYALGNILWCLDERNPASLTQPLPFFRRYWKSIRLRRLIVERLWPLNMRNALHISGLEDLLRFELQWQNLVEETNSQIHVLKVRRTKFILLILVVVLIKINVFNLVCPWFVAK